MKKTLLIVSCALATFIGQSQTTAIPDANFEAKLIDLGWDDVADNSVLTANIANRTDLNIGNPNAGAEITNLTGIEDFTALQTLNAVRNNLTVLNLSSNINLTSVRAFENPNLATIDVSNSPNLVELNLGACNVAAIDVSNNTLLEVLTLNINALTSVDVTSNTALKVLNVLGNALTSLNMKNGNNTNINDFKATGNQLTCIQVDSKTYMDAEWPLAKDPGASYEENCVLSVDDFRVSASKDVVVSPNPTANDFTIQNIGSDDVAVRIYNALGSEVLTTSVNANDNTVDVQGLAKGVYFVRLNDSDVKRIVKK